MPRKNPIPAPPAIVERPDGTEAEDGEFALLPDEPESVKDAFYHPNPRLTAEKEPVDDPEDDIVIPAERAVALIPQHHVVTGMAALAALPEEEFQAKLAVMKAGQERVRIIQRELMEDGEDYGKVSGVDRPFLHQPGAEKLGNFYGLASRHEVERVVGTRKRVTVGEITTDTDEWASPPLTYIARTYVHVGDFEGPIVAEGRGECNSWEDKYRYRWSKSQCPQCGHDLMKGGANGKMAGKWFCPGFKGGCWWSVAVTATNEDGTPVVKAPVRIDNPDPFGAAETLLQMAVKRSFVAAIRRATGTSGLFTQDDDVVRSMQGDDDGNAPEPVVEPAEIGIPVQPGAKVEGQTQVQQNRLKALVQEKELTPIKIADLLTALFGIGLEPADGPNVSAAVRNLNGEQTGRLIQAIETGEITDAVAEASAPSKATN